MTLVHKNKDSSEHAPLLCTANDSEASTSGVPPPSFEESAGHVVVDLDNIVDMFPVGGEEPPEFTPYNAEHWVSKNGDIVSHDPHLNEDGEALYRFLLSQAETPPTLRIHCRGTHDETQTRLVDRTDSRGRKYTDTEHYTETVTDFDFMIEHQVPPHATQWTVGDDVPAYRGRMTREVGPPGGAIKADRRTKKAFKSWLVERQKRGLPPWVGPPSDNLMGPTDLQQQQSSWTLRQWADDYCQSRKVLKEFVYEKIVYGWDIDKLEAAVRAAIKSTNYRGDHVQVDFKLGQKSVMVRPDTVISRAISNPWLRFLLVITLIYPFIYLFQHYHSRGGGRWAVGGGAYPLKRWQLVSEGGVIGRYTEGRSVLIGEREGQWFQKWEGTIRRSVMGRKVESRPMEEPEEEVTNWPARELDGFS